MTEAELIQKLEKIQRLFAGAKTVGERDAAANALDRVQAKLDSMPQTELAEEYKFSMDSRWSRKLFVALLRKYGFEPYRYKRQRLTTVMARVPKSFVDTTLWPEFTELSSVLDTYIAEVTNRVIRSHIHEDATEAVVKDESMRLKG